MFRDRIQTDLTCRKCRFTQRCGPTLMMERLADIGMMKRDADPSLELLLELVRSAADRLHCPRCDGVGLAVTEADDDAWDEVRHCERCRAPIPVERIEVFPDATRCAACQNASDQGSDQEREFCKHCGSVMSVQLRRTPGSAAYQLKCPDCGR